MIKTRLMLLILIVLCCPFPRAVAGGEQTQPAQATTTTSTTNAAPASETTQKTEAPAAANSCHAVAGSPEVDEFNLVFWSVMIPFWAGLLAALGFLLAGKWSLADALAEESSEQPKAIIDKKSVIMVASVSRLIALIGLLVIIVLILEIGYAAAWHLFVCGSVPDLGGIKTFLLAMAALFTPYIVNQIREMVSSPKPAAVQTEAPAIATAGPKISSMHPSALQVKSTDQVLTFYGAGFQLPLTVNLTDPAGAVAAPPPTIVEAGPTYFKAQARLKAGGSWTVQATGPGTVPASFAFSVEAPVAVITNATAPAPGGGVTDRLITIDGQFLMPGATVTFTPAAGGTAITKDLTAVSDTQATTTATLSTGQWTATVTNAGGRSSAAQTFTAA